MKRNEIEIRLIEKRDNEGIYRLIQSILESYGLDKPGTAYFDPYLNDLYHYYQKQPNGEYWVLLKNEKVYGGIGVGPFGDYEHVAEIQKYYISQELQGLGFGRALYETAENYAKEKGYKTLYIETTHVLNKANRIYEHFGFSRLNAPLEGTEHTSMDTWLIKEL